jgi:DNA mismatch repair protein MutL
MVVLFIALPPSTVDVNVHPTKAEVKFKDPERVYQAVSAAIRALLESKESLSQAEERTSAEGKEWFFQERAQSPFFGQDTLSFSPAFRAGRAEQGFMVREGQGGQWDVGKRWHSPVLGQIEGTYIVCERDGNLIFIDQHAAHERILFEKFKREYESKSMISEKLLLPILIELSMEESYILESAGEALRRIGFEIESVGEKLFTIRSIPTFIDQKDPKEMVRGILDELSFSERKGKGEETLHTILITLACHSAIRGNFPLKREEMDKLVEDLAAFHPASTCPHGRPIFFVLPLEELRKQFKRR